MVHFELWVISRKNIPLNIWQNGKRTFQMYTNFIMSDREKITTKIPSPPKKKEKNHTNLPRSASRRLGPGAEVTYHLVQY